MVKKYYVLDTNVILEYPALINSFRDAVIIIPDIVLEELDNFKSDNDLGKNARFFSNFLDKLHDIDYYIEDINVKVIIPTYEGNEIKNDNKIIEAVTCLKSYDVTLLSNDINVRIKARQKGVKAEQYNGETSNNLDLIYKGYEEVYINGEIINQLYQQKYLMNIKIDQINLYPHMFLKLIDYSNYSRTAIAKVTADCKSIELLNPDINIWGFSPKNVHQRMFMELLINPNIPLVAATGPAGTGKTLLSLASALYQTKDKKMYDKILLTKPTVAASEEIGFLPGNMEEKLHPWLSSYYDNLDYLLGGKSNDLEMLNIEINALTYMRGRSLPNQFIIVDEVQNLSKKEVKTILTRASEGTKIVLMGDINQIDKKNLDSINNGLTYVINKFKGQDIFGCIHLDKGVRSKLATLASELL